MKKIKVWIHISVISIFLLAILFVFISIHRKNKEYMNMNENELVAHLINTYYILETDFTEEELKKREPEEMVELLNDKYSCFLTASELEQDVQALNNSYVGLGFEASKRVGEYLEILSIIPNSPSSLTGLEVGDLILKIDGKDTLNMNRKETLSLIRGAVDSSIILTIQRGKNNLFEVMLTRKPIDNDVLEYKLMDNNIGYIYISEFPLKTAELFTNGLNFLIGQGMESLILDLRGNTGGEIEEIEPIASSLLEEDLKNIFFIERKDKSRDIYKRVNDSIFTGDIVVLCDKSTASSAELLISILKDYNRCKVMGENTYGKQISQEFFYMNSGNILKLSTGLMLSPNEEIFNKVGIKPDYIVPMDYKSSTDTQLDKAIEILNS